MIGGIEKTIISIVLAYITSQLIKYVVDRIKGNPVSIISFFTRNAGMPSTHTSTTVALTASLFFNTGMSYLLILAGLFTLIVINDATHVRRETGEEAAIVNKLASKAKMKIRNLSENVGHKPIEVFVGLIIGTFWALILYVI